MRDRPGIERTPQGRGPRASHRASGTTTQIGRSLTATALVVTVVILFGVSGGVLWAAGINYDGLSGSAAAKIHPATYLSVFLLAWVSVADRNPVGGAIRRAGMRPASLWLLFVTVVLVIHIALRSASGLAGTIDSFAGPALLILAMSNLDDRGLGRIETAIHAVMTANALLGLAEFVSGYLVFPFRFEGAVFETDLRSAALQGHPLANATVTGVYVLALISGGGVSLPAVLRLPIIALQLAALVTFGGRSAMVVVLVLGGAYGIVAANRTLRSNRLSLLSVFVVLLLLAVGPLVGAVLVAGGFFDRFAERFVSDGGSANARIEMFDLVGRLHFRDLLIGPDTALVDSLRRVGGLEWGIENPIIRMMLYQGIFMTAIMTIAVVLFMMEIVRWSRVGVFLPTLAFAILLNTSESLAGKTTMLTKFAVMMLSFYRPVLDDFRMGIRRAGRDAEPTTRRGYA